MRSGGLGWLAAPRLSRRRNHRTSDTILPLASEGISSRLIAATLGASVSLRSFFCSEVMRGAP